MKLWGTCASDDATLLAGSNHQSLLEIFGWMRDAEDNREGPARCGGWGRREWRKPCEAFCNRGTRVARGMSGRRSDLSERGDQVFWDFPFRHTRQKVDKTFLLHMCLGPLGSKYSWLDTCKDKNIRWTLYDPRVSQDWSAGICSVDAFKHKPLDYRVIAKGEPTFSQLSAEYVQMYRLARSV